LGDEYTKISGEVKDISFSYSFSSYSLGLSCGQFLNIILLLFFNLGAIFDHKGVLRGHCTNNKKAYHFSDLSSLTQTNAILRSHNEIIISQAPSALARLASSVLKVWLRP
jgi:hypothetical protein